MQMKSWKILTATLLLSCIGLGIALYFSLPGLEYFQRSMDPPERLSKSDALIDSSASDSRPHATDLFRAYLRIASLATAKGQYDEASSALLDTLPLQSAASSQERFRRNLMVGHLEIIQDILPEKVSDGGLALYVIKISPDGRWLAIGGEKGYLAVYGMFSGQLKKRLIGHLETAGRAGSITSLGFARDGTLLSSGGDGNVIHWSMPSGDIINRFKTGAPVIAMAINPVKDFFATGDLEGLIRIRSIKTGKIVRSLKSHKQSISPLNGLSYSPDGKLLASASLDATARIWKSSNGQLLHTLKGHDRTLSSVSFNHDSQLLVTSDNSGRLLVWASSTGALLRMLNRGGSSEEAIHHAIFSFDHRRIFTAGVDARIRVWDLIGGKLLRELMGQGDEAWSLFLHRQKLFAATYGGVSSWSSITHGQWQWEVGGEPITTSLSDNGKIAATGFSDGSIRFYRLPDGEEQGDVLQAHKEALSSIAYSKDSKRLASASGGEVKIWRVSDPSNPIELDLENTLPQQEKPIRSIVFSPDGSQLAIAVESGLVILYDMLTQTQQEFMAHAGGVASAVFDDSGKQLLTAATKTRMAKIWNLTKKISDPVHAVSDITGWPFWASFSPDGKQISVIGKDGFIGTAASSASSKSAGFSRFEARHQGNALKVSYTPDGGTLVTIGSDAILRFINSEDGLELFHFKLPTLQRSGIPSALDLDLRCIHDYCDLLIPLTIGRVVLYRIKTTAPIKQK